MVSDSEDTLHKVFTNDPVQFKSMVDNEVEVETIHGGTLKGFLYTIDPVSEAAVILNPTEDGLKVEIVTAFNIKNIKITETPSALRIPDNLFKDNWSKFLSEEEVEKKRLQLKEWLLKNSIPIEESDKSLKLADVLTIEPPYGVDQCMSKNETVLSRMQDLIKSMPAVS